jgi:hypothetical protein
MTVCLFDQMSEESGIWFGCVDSRSEGEVRSVCDE